MTERYRIITTLSRPTFEAFERLAELQGRSKGSVVAEIMETLAPSMTRTIALLEAARDAHPAMLHELRDMVQGVERDMYQAVGQRAGALEDIYRQMDEVAATAKGPTRLARGKGAVAARSSSGKVRKSPPSSNTGGKSPSKPLPHGRKV